EQEAARVAGVSSFGFGGANAHAIITSVPAPEPPPAHDPMPRPETVMLSAHSPTALARTAGHLAERAPQGRSVGTVADTALAHGNHYRHRAAVVTDNLGGLVQGLRSIQDRTPNPDVVGPALAPTTRPRMVFVYTGHGGHPRYVFGGPATGSLACGPGMTVSPCRRHDLGGGVTGPDRCRQSR